MHIPESSGWNMHWKGLEGNTHIRNTNGNHGK